RDVFGVPAGFVGPQRRDVGRNQRQSIIMIVRAGGSKKIGPGWRCGKSALHQGAAATANLLLLNRTTRAFVTIHTKPKHAEGNSLFLSLRFKFCLVLVLRENAARLARQEWISISYILSWRSSD